MKQFSTSDIYLTAALAAKGLRPDKTDTANGRLVFSWNNPQAKEVADEYYGKTLMVNARLFAEEVKIFKTLCHAPV